MKNLIIFDNALAKVAFTDIHKTKGVIPTDIFPLVENHTLTKWLLNTLHVHGINEVFCYNSSEIIQKYVAYLRENIGQWAANIAHMEIDGRQIKEWFMLPGLDVSSWWFGLIAERNTWKTDIFLRIAQVHAIKSTLINGNYSDCVVVTTHSAFGNSIFILAKELGIGAKIIRISLSQRIKCWIKDYADKFEILNLYVSVLSYLIQSIKRSIKTRLYLKFTHRKLPDQQYTIFVSYFPYVDCELAEQGIFYNKYAYLLQKKLKDLNKEVIWVLMAVGINGTSYRNAVKLTRKFIDCGEKMFMLEEFFTLKDALFAFRLWISQIRIARHIYKQIYKNGLSSTPIGRECLPLVKSLWNTSFYGVVAIDGLIYTLAYRRLFREMSKADDCIYYAEMHAWERALNAARRGLAPKIRTIGYQCANVPPNSFNFFSHPEETATTTDTSGLPLPNVFACCGDYLYDLLKPCRYPGLRTVEATRYLYMDDHFTSCLSKKNEYPALLVAGSLHYGETLSMFSLLHSAFPKASKFKILCKGHPALPLEKIMNDLNIDIRESGYDIVYDDIEKCLKSVWAVLAPSSSVAMEALALGREVIVPVFPDALMMNPVADFEGYCYMANSACELQKAIERILAGEILQNIEDYRKLVRRYWCIDKEMPRWTRMLIEDKTRMDVIK